MKLSKTSIVLIVIGAILVIAAPIWRWVVAPQFIRIPDDIEVESVYEGTLTLYADPDTMVFYTDGKEIPVDITRTDTSVPEKSSSDVAVIRETVEVKNRETGEILEEYGWDRAYALDRQTSENVSYEGVEKDRKGYYIMLPMGTETKSYDMWDEDLERTGEVDFIKKETRSGEKHKSVEVYVFGTDSDLERIYGTPPGMPAELSGAQIKELLQDPSVDLPDTLMLPIEYYKKTEVQLVVEPRTGAFVDIPLYHEEYYANKALPGDDPDYILLAEIDYSQIEENVMTVVDDTAEYFGLLDLVKLWIPLIFLVMGLIFLLVGLFLGRQPSKSKGGEGREE